MGAISGGETSVAEATEVLTLVSLQGHGRYRWNSMLLNYIFFPVQLMN